MNEPTFFLSTELSWRSWPVDRAHLDKLEDALHKLAGRFKGVRRGTSSASASEDGRHFETFTLLCDSTVNIEKVATAAVAIVRKHGIPKGVTVEQTKRCADPQRDDVHKRRIYPVRETLWSVVSSRQLNSSHEQAVVLPQRIAYLSSLAEQFYQAGGKDIHAVLRRDEDARQFVCSLSKAQRSRWQEAYRRMVSQYDHLWITDWVMEDAPVTIEKAKASYFLVLLDRLCQHGLLANRSNLPRVTLVDWNRLG